jgi:hypothetical protein
VCGPDLHAPAPAYRSDLLIAAIGADRPVLQIDSPQPGTILVDDSFPHPGPDLLARLAELNVEAAPLHFNTIS